MISVPQFSVPAETLQTTHCSFTAPSLSPVTGWRGELEAQKEKIIGRDKKNLLETAVKWEINSSSNNISKRVY